MYGTHIPALDPVEVVAALVAALAFVVLCGLAAAIALAFAERALPLLRRFSASLPRLSQDT